MKLNGNIHQLQRPLAVHCARWVLFVAIAIGALAEAVLVQPNNYMLDDSPLTSQHDTAGSLSPFYNDQTGANEQTADKDIVSIIGDGLARLRFARMLEQQQAGQEEAGGQLSQEMAELIQEGQQQQQQAKGEQGEQQSLSSSMASMLMNVAQAAAAAAQSNGPNEEHTIEHQNQRAAANQQDAARSQILELDTNQAGQSANSQASKLDLKSSSSQWYNPKETIPVLKISSMATPSKYKKVYFRSEKKLVDGAFHSAASEQEQKKPALVAKPLSSAVQRRSSRGSAGGAPPGVLQDGVIDFLKKFRDVYVQTRPAGAVSSSGSSLASNLVSAASSPFAAFLAPASAGSRPNLASAISTASQMVNSAAMLSQAASSVATAPASSGSSSAATAATSSAAAGSSPSKSPLSAQTYVSFWSKTFPTWVRKMLKQMRRRSLYNSSRRQQQQQQHQHAHGIGQKAAGSNAVGNVVSDSSSQSSSGSSSS